MIQAPHVGSTSGLTIDSNVISGNDGYGIRLARVTLMYYQWLAVQITNNLIGTDATGSFAIPNGRDGIWLKFAQATLLAAILFPAMHVTVSV